MRRLTNDEQRAHDVVREVLLRASKNPDMLADHDVAAALYSAAREVVGVTDPTLDSWLVSDALSQLTPEHRTVIIRAYYMGQSVADLAEALDVPEATILSRLHYGLRALRLALQERGVTGP
ncbi:sigma factor-like helix-turn-helix DNA-binding protein [Kibdelosporangium persicum]|uniref:ECF RNA polymerase sigma factor SigL n=1 Tax=Kibdelosporangium persicum TaxID=2698649 RepID=A0ABX2FHU2_9PSEU|nr:sigma factor-like helix-turn-helix DNA-binding protein [Kibdelosporangium persicum]NRN70442.1 ECF RNA polymerase sigma factor SigL [Kibdelosporangium persicum]